MTHSTHWIGLIGKNGSGKSTVCSLLQSEGFEVISLSDFVREEATRLGLDHTRDHLTNTGNALKAEYGLDVLATRAIERANRLATSQVVFDSIRHPSEVALLQQSGTTMLGVSASLETRYQRISARQKDTDHVSFDTFAAQDARENEGKSSGQHIDAALKHCDTVILNEGSLEDLKQQLSTFLSVA